MIVKNTFLVVIGFFSISFPSFASCSSCPKSSGKIEDFIARISEALISPEQNVMLIRSMSKVEMDDLLAKNVFPSKELRQKLYAGQVLTGFKVIDSLNQSSQIVLRFAEIGNRPRRSPEGFGGPFVPNAGTEWLVITSKDPTLSTTLANVSCIDLKDQIDGILSAKSDNRFGINATSLLGDLKVIKSAILAKEILNPSNLQTGIGRAVLKNVTAVSK